MEITITMNNLNFREMAYLEEQYAIKGNFDSLLAEDFYKRYFKEYEEMKKIIGPRWVAMIKQDVQKSMDLTAKSKMNLIKKYK